MWHAHEQPAEQHIDIFFICLLSTQMPCCLRTCCEALSGQRETSTTPSELLYLAAFSRYFLFVHVCSPGGHACWAVIQLPRLVDPRMGSTPVSGASHTWLVDHTVLLPTSGACIRQGQGKFRASDRIHFRFTLDMVAGVFKPRRRRKQDYLGTLMLPGQESWSSHGSLTVLLPMVYCQRICQPNSASNLAQAGVIRGI